MTNVSGNLVMTYGKYKYQKFDDIPADYLLFMLDAGKLYGLIKDYTIENKEFLQNQIKNERKGIR